MRYYEDIEIGDTEEFGEYHVTKDEILEFAEQYDPSRSTPTRTPRRTRPSAN